MDKYLLSTRRFSITSNAKAIDTICIMLELEGISYEKYKLIEEFEVDVKKKDKGVANG